MKVGRLIQLNELGLAGTASTDTLTHYKVWDILDPSETGELRLHIKNNRGVYQVIHYPSWTTDAGKSDTLPETFKMGFGDNAALSRAAQERLMDMGIYRTNGTGTDTTPGSLVVGNGSYCTVCSDSCRLEGLPLVTLDDLYTKKVAEAKPKYVSSIIVQGQKLKYNDTLCSIDHEDCAHSLEYLEDNLRIFTDSNSYVFGNVAQVDSVKIGCTTFTIQDIKDVLDWLNQLPKEG